MTHVIFWDVDTQYDFMRADGKLYVPHAETIIPNLATLRAYASAVGIRTIATADDHVPEHEEISDDPDFKTTFPPHCMRGTPGQQRIPETALIDPILIEPDPVDPEILKAEVSSSERDVLLHKHAFDIFTNPNVEPVLDAIDPKTIVLFGVALDVCDRYAVEGLLERRPDTDLAVVTDAVSAIDDETGARLLQEWAERGVRMTTTADVTQAA